MKYKLKVLSVYELGQRNNQEDYMVPEHMTATAEDRVFVLCDGMGGHSAGEVASRLVCEAMSSSVKASCPDPEGVFTDEDFKKALSEAYDSLDQNDTGDIKKMGTTMTFLKFHQDGATIAHIGDSRVYHIRSGAEAASTEILFQTSDHSLVNDLVKIGEMTPEEAKVSTQKNVITRAMQPNLERRPSADIHHISDIKAGDYFFMCSDGILEYMEDEHVQYIFSEEAGDIDKKVDIIIKATANNRDNHTAFLISVDEVEGALMEEVAADLFEMEEKPHVRGKGALGTGKEPVGVVEKYIYANLYDEETPKQSRKWLPVLVILCLIAGLLFFAKDLFMDKKQEKPAEHAPDKELVDASDNAAEPDQLQQNEIQVK